MAWCWINGRLALVKAAFVGVSDRGFLYGDGLYETLRVYGRHPHLLAEHAARMEAGASVLGLALPYTANYLAEGVAAVIRANTLRSGVIRITISRGEGVRGLIPPADPHPTTVITAFAGISYSKSCYTGGLRAIMLPWPRNEHSPLVWVKSLSCLENVLGAVAARRAGADEGLFLNGRGHLTEGTTANLFVVKSGRILTPPAASGLLPGITRARVMASGLRVAEALLTMPDLLEADEAFLTNSVLGVAPLVQLDGRHIGDGRPGPLTRQVMDWYEAEAGFPAGSGGDG